MAEVEERIRGVFLSYEGGRCVVRLYDVRDQAYKEVEVDDRIPCTQNTKAPEHRSWKGLFPARKTTMPGLRTRLRGDLRRKTYKTY